MQLRSRGLGLASNVSYSFLYVLTEADALHGFGGLGGLVPVIGKLRNGVLRRSTLDANSRAASEGAGPCANSLTT